MSLGGLYLLFQQMGYPTVHGIVLLGLVAVIGVGVLLLWDSLSRREWN